MVPVDAVASRARVTIEVLTLADTVSALHALPMPTDGDVPQAWILRPTDVAVAMGSSQKPELFDHARLQADGVALAERRSGGGAVFIDPVSVVWIDVLAPRTSDLWSDQLTENFLIVGRVWQRALASLGVETELIGDAGERTPASTLACWAGMGWGELVVEGAKVVGLSQRRTRWGARVQGMAVLDASSARVSDYFSPSDQSTLKGAISTAHVAAVTGAPEVTTAALQQAVIDELLGLL